jgi:hypothetical protein
LGARHYYDAIAEVACAAANRKTMARFEDQGWNYSRDCYPTIVARADRFLQVLFPEEGAFRLPPGLALMPVPAPSSAAWPVEDILQHILPVVTLDTFRQLTNLRLAAINAIAAAETTPALKLLPLSSPSDSRLPCAQAVPRAVRSRAGGKEGAGETQP